MSPREAKAAALDGGTLEKPPSIATIAGLDKKLKKAKEINKSIVLPVKKEMGGSTDANLNNLSKSKSNSALGPE